MSDYSTSVIYQIICNDDNVKETYWGSTIDFDERYNTHKQVCSNHNHKNHHYKVYKFIRSTGGFSNWTMKKVKNYPCETKLELRKEEQTYIDIDRSMCLNDKDAYCNEEGRLAKQKKWYQDNKEEIMIKRKKYTEEHKEEIAIKQKQYRQDNNEKLSIQKKQYNKDNKEKLFIQQKQYREDNKDRISAYKGTKHNCECGAGFTNGSKSQHYKSNKHIIYHKTTDFLTEIETIYKI
mgnify:CR=1 FL=1